MWFRFVVTTCLEMSSTFNTGFYIVSELIPNYVFHCISLHWVEDIYKHICYQLKKCVYFVCFRCVENNLFVLSTIR